MRLSLPHSPDTTALLGPAPDHHTTNDPGHAPREVAPPGGRRHFWCRDEPRQRVARLVSLSRRRSTRPTPGPTSLWNSSLLGAPGWGRVGASFLAVSTLAPSDVSSS